MENLPELATLSVRRACGFAALAICTFIVGFSPIPVLALKVGAGLTAIMMLVLLVKARLTETQHYKTTEVWMMLGRPHGLTEEQAQRMIMSELRGVYLRHAEISAYVTLGLWGTATLIWLAG